MIRRFAAAAGAELIFLATTSCRTASDAVALPRLEPAANPAGQAVTLKGRLVRSGACLAVVDGGGTTIIIWPRTAQARVGGSGNTIIVLPFRRTARRSAPARRWSWPASSSPRTVSADVRASPTIPAAAAGAIWWCARRGWRTDPPAQIRSG